MKKSEATMKAPFPSIFFQYVLQTHSSHELLKLQQPQDKAPHRCFVL
jgi:hypothetical protein